MHLSIKNIISLNTLTEGTSCLVLGGQKSKIEGIDFDFSSMEGKEDLIS